MKVMMLGWEYPPLISGGLATASEGLTRALSAQGVEIDFVLPRTCGREDAKHMSIFSCNELKTAEPGSRVSTPKVLSDAAVDSLIGSLYSSYARPRTQAMGADDADQARLALPPEWLDRRPEEIMSELVSSNKVHDPLFQEVWRYAREVAQTSHARKFDIVHAHDWMTFPAGILLARAAGVPLVTHVHSLESDRCGDGGNALIRVIESVGVSAADRIIAVSHYTRHVICTKLGIDPDRVAVAHNGVKQPDEPFAPHLTGETPLATDAPTDAHPESSMDTASDRPSRKKRVLFLGRVTYQKGPDIFVEAAAQVLKHNRDVVFVLAGSGDMLPRVRDRVREMGMEEYFEFPGFVTGKKLDDEFGRADLYVMPSISEPFGIAPLEALTRGTPALISKQSGVSEVLSHVLKSDFWDVRKMADFILNAILHPELGRSMMAMSQNEVRRLRWESAAKQVISTYQNVLSGHASRR